MDDRYSDSNLNTERQSDSLGSAGMSQSRAGSSGGASNSSGSESVRMLKTSLKDGSFREMLQDWKWIIGYSVRYKKSIIFYVIMGILSTTFSLVSAVMSKYLIDIITGYQYSKLWFVVFAMVFSTVLHLALRSIMSRVNLKISLTIGNDIRADIFDKVIDADWFSISQYQSGDILNRFNDDIRTVSYNAVSWLPTVIMSAYRFIATFLLLMYYDPVMALIAFTGAPFVIFISRSVMRKQREYGKRVRKTSSDMMAFEAETFYNFDTIKSFGITGRFSGLLHSWQERFKEISLQHNSFTIKTNIVLSSIAMLVSFASFAYCLFRLWTHDITYGTMTLFLQQRQALEGAFNNVLKLVPDFLNSSVSAHRIRELVELPREKHLAASGELDQYKENGLTVAMENVEFSYIEGKKVISESDFIASPGEIVALVGPSGEGKTTMIRLILGLIHPNSGSVSIRAVVDDKRLAGEKDAACRNGPVEERKEHCIEVTVNADTRYLFAYVPQGNTILSGTIADNLRMVREDASDEQIIDALKTACIWEFVEKLPDGINARLGEKGKGVSEGQAQRIAIARAVLKDAPVLLLDEATSALDVTTERKVLRNIMQYHPNKTIIITSHRPSVLSMCRRIYGVVETQVVELDSEEAGKMAIDF